MIAPPPTVARYEVEIEGRVLVLEGPPSPDDVVREAVARGETEPAYWAHLWPSAPMLARYVRHSLWVGPGTRVLEVGCGLGLAGIVAAIRGASVTMTDVDPRAVRCAQRNADLNAACAQTAQFDWNEAPDPAWQVDVLLGADVLYRRDSHMPLSRLVRRLGATAIFADPNRELAGAAMETMREAGLAVWSAAAPGGRIIIAQAR